MGSTVSVTEEDAAGLVDGVPSLVCALSCDRLLAPPRRFALDDIAHVTLGRGDACARDRARLVVRIPDDRRSEVHARLVRSEARVVVRARHRRSGRAGPFLALTCGAIPAT